MKTLIRTFVPVLGFATLLLSSVSFAQPLYGTGALPPRQTIEPDIYNMARPAPALPASKYLNQWAVPVGDQGQVGSCTAWAVAHGLMGWYAKYSNMAHTNFAPMYMYSQINSYYMSHRSDCDPGKCGSTIESALQLAYTQGVATTDNYLPQGDYTWDVLPTKAQRANAANYKFGNWPVWQGAARSVLFSYKTSMDGTAGAAGIQAIQNALVNNKPVVIGIFVSPKFYNLKNYRTWETAIDDVSVPVPTPEGVGRHAVLVLGYDPIGLIIQNSWGPNWGNNGFARIAWSAAQSNVYEAWVVNEGFHPNWPITSDVSTRDDGHGGGTISPYGTFAVPSGETRQFTVTPKPGYYIREIYGCNGRQFNGNSSSTTAYTYTTGGAITGVDCTVVASFAQTENTVTGSAFSGGSISPPSAKVKAGATQTFAVTPNPGYYIRQISGCNGTQFSGSSSNTTKYNYTTGAITSACTVYASFDPVPSVYTVTVSPTNGGRINPESVKVKSGAIQTFLVTPNPGYYIYQISGCNGKQFNGSSTSTTTQPYTTGAITRACMVNALFFKKAT